MATGFGGAPGLSLLTGVAKGITEEEERRKQAVRDAIMDRLRNTQIRAAEQDITLSAAEEGRRGTRFGWEGQEEGRRGTRFGWEQGNNERAVANAARNDEERNAVFESLLTDYQQQHPNATRADAQRYARARMSEEYVDPADDRREDRAGEAAIEHTRSGTTANYANADQSRAGASYTRAQEKDLTTYGRVGRTGGASAGGGIEGGNVTSGDFNTYRTMVHDILTAANGDAVTAFNNAADGNKNPLMRSLIRRGVVTRDMFNAAAVEWAQDETKRRGDTPQMVGGRMQRPAPVPARTTVAPGSASAAPARKSWEDRAEELEAQGKTDAQILQTLRSEGYEVR